MKNLLMVQRGTTIHRPTARLAVTVLFAALLVAAPFHAAFAQTAPDLGAAAGFGVLAGTAVTCTDSTVVGDVGVSPGTAVTQTNCTIVGAVHANDAAAIAANAAFFTAYDDLQLNYPCTDTLSAVYTGVTVTLTPGVYCSTSFVEFTNTTLILDAQGDANAVWIFKIGTVDIAGYLTGTGLSVIMANGGQPCNVYWWTAAAATMTTTNFKGNLLAGAATTITGGSFIMGRDFAKAAVTLTNADIVSCTNIVPPPLPPIDFCKDYCKDYCKDHDKNKKHCNQGVGNGPEGCDPGNSNHGDDDWSNDEHGGKPGHPGRKGGNDKDHDKDHRDRR